VGELEDLKDLVRRYFSAGEELGDAAEAGSIPVDVTGRWEKITKELMDAVKEPEE